MIQSIIQVRVFIVLVLLGLSKLVTAQFAYLDTLYDQQKYGWEYAYSSVKLSDDKFILVDYAGNSNYVMNIFCINATGTILWDKEYNMDSLDDYSTYQICLDKENNIIIAAEYYNDSLGGEQAIMAKTDSNGNLQWIKAYPAPQYGEYEGLYGNSTLAIDSGHYLLVCALGVAKGNSDFLVIKTDTAGNELSRWQYGTPYYEAPWGGDRDQ